MFLEDPALNLIGYQVNFDFLEEGLLLFNHDCNTTLAILAGKFKDLHQGPDFLGRLTNTDECPEYCLRKEELRPCPAKCECAYVRGIIQIINRWPKNSIS